MTPTVKNIYNKFSVRFFLKVVLVVAQNYFVRSKREAEREDEEESEELERNEEDDIEVLERYEEESGVDSNFIELNFFR